MKKLTEQEIEENIKDLQYWDLEEGMLVTSLDFKNFADAFAMMTRIAFEAEANNHHPDWSNVYNNLTIRLTTHDAGGLTDKDFYLARRIEDIINGD
ncbi:4a-hydroxytetrahydrobiopterin dehydratase [Robertkochia marina]|uniref:Putative pterin-4-alpha-carbinolamine dehydratase n=1 Tax=Robertkochia marina TaxID=1227945 RepID=A0A4S3LYK4_9FLAO|nr:4a-hydroxytetrahydrobiopterin dehydratase [Robertkochia marina]THD66688.1 4a-hydroxytetrahydrobiopterin dehydratase [Robertkochia marina]TRZ45474.1 4a-hydroxytetrahydrobiopterin dehydratase [Robertkochia marina]